MADPKVSHCYKIHYNKDTDVYYVNLGGNTFTDLDVRGNTTESTNGTDRYGYMHYTFSKNKRVCQIQIHKAHKLIKNMDAPKCLCMPDESSTPCSNMILVIRKKMENNDIDGIELCPIHPFVYLLYDKKGFVGIYLSNFDKLFPLKDKKNKNKKKKKKKRRRKKKCG